MTSNKKVNLYDIRGNYLRTFDSLTECAWWLGSITQSIYESLQGTGYHKHYQLRYYTGNTDNITSWIKDREPYYKKVYYLISKDSDTEIEFESTIEVANHLGVSRELVRVYTNKGWFCKKKFKVKRATKLVSATFNN